MLAPTQHRFDEIAVIEIDRAGQVREVAGGEIERRLRQVDAVIVARLVPRSAVLIMLASPQAMSRKVNGEGKTSFRVSCRMAPTSRWAKQSLSTSLR